MATRRSRAPRRRRKRGISTYEMVVGTGAVGFLVAVRAGDWLGRNALIVGVVVLVVGVLAIAMWRRRRSRRRTILTTLAGLLALDPTGFEHAVADIYRAAGLRNARVVGGAGDLAIDIDGREPSGRPVVIQCKRYAPGYRIGSPEVQKFLGMARYRDETARRILVTTSDFTEPARQVGRHGGVELVDGHALVALALTTSRPTEQPDPQPTTA